MTVLVAYASKHGSTEGIATFLADRLRELGEDAVARPVEEVSDLEGVDALVLGSAVYAGSWMKEAMAFVERNRTTLPGMPVWLFSSGPLGDEVKDEEEQPRQLKELQEMLSPRDHQMFFGALDRDKLGFGERMIVKAIKAPQGDFRDWDAIRGWADQIVRDLE